jgi:hypothetical protein
VNRLEQARTRLWRHHTLYGVVGIAFCCDAIGVLASPHPNTAEGDPLTFILAFLGTVGVAACGSALPPEDDES